MALSAEDYRQLHLRARRPPRWWGWLYWMVLRLLRPLLGVLFRPQVQGLEHLPASGAAIVAANHRSIYDFLFQAWASPRPLRWMAAAEMFERPLRGRLSLWLGAFPVLRDQSDQEAIHTAQQLLRSGQLLCIFPEGRTVRWGDPGEPRRGAGRLALECGVPIVPLSMVGTERLSPALWHRGHRVRLRFDAPVHPQQFPAPAPDPEDARQLTEEQLWPRVRQGIQSLEWDRQRALRAGGLAAGALLLGLAARRYRRRPGS